MFSIFKRSSTTPNTCIQDHYERQMRVLQELNIFFKYHIREKLQKNRIISLQDQIKQQDQNFQAKNSDYTDLKCEHQKLQESFNAQVVEINSFKTEFEELKNDHKALIEKNTMIIKDRDDLQNKLTDMSFELDMKQQDFAHVCKIKDVALESLEKMEKIFIRRERFARYIEDQSAHVGQKRKIT